METHQQIKECFLNISDIFKEYLNEPENKKLLFQKDTHEWLNYFYSSPILRHTHLEFYKTEKICVLHINVFPDSKIDMPILGFDMIALGNKITGLFFDYTPTFTSFSKLDYDLDYLKSNFKSKKRELPDWANFFSKNFYCIEPISEELDSILQNIKNSIKKYFEVHRDEILKLQLRIKKQNEYCAGQKKNDKTYKALAVEIGEKNAKEFLNRYLFPEII